jgi:hypothetical protein
MGRMDCFRLMSLRALQVSSDYDPERRTESSIQWTGDIIAADKPPAKIWSQDLKPEKISRGLLSDHMEALYVALALQPS